MQRTSIEAKQNNGNSHHPIRLLLLRTKIPSNFPQLLHYMLRLGLRGDGL
jgi:hypothetical protein